MVRRIECKNNYAFSIPLPPVAERPNPNTVASLDRWHMVLVDHHHPCWNRFVITGASLADFPGVEPANKHFPEATHEIVVAAIDPSYDQESFDSGGVAFLEPLNYVEQFAIKSDEIANELLRHLAEAFVHNYLPAEPQGIIGAKELFRSIALHFLSKQDVS